MKWFDKAGLVLLTMGVVVIAAAVVQGGIDHATVHADHKQWIDLLWWVDHGSGRGCAS